MPYQDSQQLSTGAFERIASSASSNESRLKDNVNIGQVLGELQHEIRFEYSRAMNKLQFDATVWLVLCYHERRRCLKCEKDEGCHSAQELSRRFTCQGYTSGLFKV